MQRPAGYPEPNKTHGTRGNRPSRENEKEEVSSPQEGYETAEEVRIALRKLGFEACELIVGVDFTKSNTWTGKKSFGGRCLHDVDGPPNPYIKSLELIAKTLNLYDDDHLIPCYGFGDVNTGRDSVFSFFCGNEPAKGLQTLVDRYKQIAPKVCMSGPTTFAPLIRQAMKEVHRKGMKFHVLLIIADGWISEECMEETKQAICDATEFPMSIVVIGVGDGPWNEMKRFDDSLPGRPWDNFQFFEFNKFNAAVANVQADRQQELFELDLLEELPGQYRIARNLTGEQKAREVAHIVNGIPLTVLIDPPAHFD